MVKSPKIDLRRFDLPDATGPATIIKDPRDVKINVAENDARSTSIGQGRIAEHDPLVSGMTHLKIKTTSFNVSIPLGKLGARIF
jgi:hypothetical protein